MSNPTKIALAKHPKAVVLLACTVADITNSSFDYEWFNTDEAAGEFAKTIRQWADDDVKDNGDLHHLIAEVTDPASDPMVLGTVTAHSNNGVFIAEWIAKIKADPSLLIAPAPRPRKVAPPKVKPQLKGLKKSPAAAALQAATPAEAPKPKAARVRKPGAKAEAAPAAPAAPAIPVQGAKALKARLAAKKQPVKAPAKAALPAMAEVVGGVLAEADKEHNLLGAIANVLKGANPKAEADKLIKV